MFAGHEAVIHREVCTAPGEFLGCMAVVRNAKKC